jgi:hypothetical protein
VGTTPNIVKEVYNIVTAVEPLPPGNCVALRTLQEDWHDRANMAIALIYLGCCDDILPLINNVNDPVVIWDAFCNRLNNATGRLGQTQVLRKITASQPPSEETVT